MKAFLGKQKLKEKAIALSNSTKSLLKFLRVRKFRLHGHASQGLVEKVTSSIPLLAAAWWPPGSLATSPAPRTWSSPCTRSSGSPGWGRWKEIVSFQKGLGSWLTLCWPDTYRCFLNRIAAYLQHASHSMLFKLLDYKRVIWFLPGVAGDQTIGQTWYF